MVTTHYLTMVHKICQWLTLGIGALVGRSASVVVQVSRPAREGEHVILSPVEGPREPRGYFPCGAGLQTCRASQPRRTGLLACEYDVQNC